MGIKAFLKNVSYAFVANIVSMLVSLVMVLVLPRYMTVADYGVWQLYLFYFSYLGFFHFGWIDGIYLRYGGEYFDKLPKERISGQLVAYFWFEILIAICLYLLFRDNLKNEYLVDVLGALCFVLIFKMLYEFASFLLQITGLIKRYSLLILVERISYFILTVLAVCFGYYGYKPMIGIQVVCQFFLAVTGLWLIRQLWVLKLPNFADILQETKENVSAGSKLLMANIAGMAVIGVVRFAISQGWSIEVFAKISLALSFSNFVLMFINSVGVVFFPMLKRMDEEKADELYGKINWLLVLILPIILVGYYPLKLVMTWWLPKYVESFVYMGILFPIFLYESRVVLLTNTYLKSLRQERALMNINLVSVLFSVLVSVIGVMWLHSLDFMIYGMLAVFIFKCLVSEYVMSKLLKSASMRPFCVVLFMTLVFVVLNYVAGQDYIAMIGTLLAYGMIVYMYFGKVKEWKNLC